MGFGSTSWAFWFQLGKWKNCAKPGPKYQPTKKKNRERERMKRKENERMQLFPKFQSDAGEEAPKTMASSRKPVPEKKSKETKKKANKGNNGKRNDKKNSRTCNGTVSSKKASPIPSSSSESQRETEDEVEITKTPTSSSKSRKGNQKGKAGREEEVGDKENVKMHKFPMDRIRRIARSEDSDLRISTEAIFLVNKATVIFLPRFLSILFYFLNLAIFF